MGFDMNLKKIDIDKIENGDVLGKDIVMNNGTVVMPSGTLLKKTYINKLKELGILYVLINEKSRDITVDITTEKKIQEQCRITVKETIDKYSYYGNVELRNITKVAEDIMEDILTEPEIIYNVSRVRDNSESTYLHSINVSALSVLISLKMKLGMKRVREVAVGGLLHDIGTIYIPFDYSTIMFEELTKEQHREIRKHVITGYSVVEKEKWLSVTAKEIILSHHERCDGSGYPMHRDGSHLKLEVKIVSVCDAFDSGVYGNFSKKMKVYEVIDSIISQASKEFDFKVVETFIASVAAYPIGTYVLTNKGETGIVIRQNIKMPARPVIQMVTDSSGKEYNTYLEKDLTKELTLFIRDTL